MRVRKLQHCFRHLKALTKVKRRGYWFVTSDPDMIRLPLDCACCLAPASTSRREYSWDSNHCVIVPYCSACLRHATRPQLLRIAAIYGSALLGIFCSILLAATWNNRYGTTATATFLALVPMFWSRWLRLPRQLGHAARDQALFVQSRGLSCASEEYARRIAPDALIGPTAGVAVTMRWRAGEFLGALVALLLTPCLHHLFFPVVRVVNFTDRSIQIVVDDQKLTMVEPTSSESPAVGETLRMPSGRHRLRALYGDGTSASDVQVEIRCGFEHLYAPGANEHCFYLQRIAYGRSRFNGKPNVELLSESRFWVIPNEVDQWFTPETSLRASRTTGGVVTLLRMQKCR